MSFFISSTNFLYGTFCLFPAFLCKQIASLHLIPKYLTCLSGIFIHYPIYSCYSENLISSSKFSFHFSKFVYFLSSHSPTFFSQPFPPNTVLIFIIPTPDLPMYSFRMTHQLPSSPTLAVDVQSSERASWSPKECFKFSLKITQNPSFCRLLLWPLSLLWPVILHSSILLLQLTTYLWIVTTDNIQHTFNCQLQILGRHAGQLAW